MLAVTPQMKILVAVEPVDFRKGIDGLVRLCKDTLQQDPFTGTLFAFRNRRGFLRTGALHNSPARRHTFSPPFTRLGKMRHCESSR